MPERPVTPPWRKPIQELNSPNHRQGFYTELVNRDDSAYQAVWPIKRGTPYASIKGSDSRVISEYSANPLYFLKQLRPGNSSSSDFGATDQAVIWIWATDALAENTYNADIDYPGESTSVSRYVRTSDIRRKDYEANPTVAYGSVLTSLLSVAITGAGTGYTRATGTIGSATAEAVCYDGQIIDWIVTVEGSSITSGASLTITGDGTGAAATARIQPATAILTHQEKKEFPPDNPRSHDYVQVLRVYEILPGATLTEVKIDPANNTEILISRTRKLKSTINEGYTLTGGSPKIITRIESEPENSFVSVEIATTWTEPAAHDEASQIDTEEEVLPYQFPAMMRAFPQWLLSVGLIGFVSSFVARVPQTTKTYWAFATEMPPLVLNGVLLLATIDNILGDGRNLGDLLVDAGTYSFATVNISITPSTPDYSTYISDYLGEVKAVRGKVTMLNPFLFRVDRVYLTYIEQAAPIYS